MESLVTRPVQTSHSGMKPEERIAAGIIDELIRLSIGIEDAEDLIADLGQALEKIYSLLFRTKVTGPLFTNSTSIMAPNSPDSMGTPPFFISNIKYS